MLQRKNWRQESVFLKVFQVHSEKHYVSNYPETLDLIPKSSALPCDTQKCKHVLSCKHSRSADVLCCRSAQQLREFTVMINDAQTSTFSESKVSLRQPRFLETLWLWHEPTQLGWSGQQLIGENKKGECRGCRHSHLQAFTLLFFKNLFGDLHKFPPKVLKLLFTCIYFKDRRVFYPLFDSIKVSSSQDRARLKPSILNSVWATCVSGRDWTSWAITTTRWLPGWALVWNWVWKQIQDLSSGISVLSTGSQETF